MIKKVKLLQVSVQPFEGKFGPTNKVGVKIKNKEGEDQWVNGFMKYSPSWQEGDEVELDIFKKEHNGKTFWNFKAPKKEDALERRIEILESQYQTLMAMVRGKNQVQEAAEAIGGTVEPDMSTPVGSSEPIDVNKIPF